MFPTYVHPDQPLLDYDDTSNHHTPPPWDSDFVNPSPHVNPPTNDPQYTASLYLSISEEAMQKAIVSSLPLLECWGCTDHP
jgi:hypothetical protein